MFSALVISVNFRSGLIRGILQPMRDILVDEKITGSFHLIPGEAYEEAGNGNRASFIGYMVSIQRPEYGGEISISTVN